MTAATDWYPIETCPGVPEHPYLLWDKGMKQPVVGERLPSGMWIVHDSYGFNEDGEIPKSEISHWANIQEPMS